MQHLPSINDAAVIQEAIEALGCCCGSVASEQRTLDGFGQEREHGRRKPGYYDPSTDNVYFFMMSGSERVRCAVTLQALEVFDSKLQRGQLTQVACFGANRKRIERGASAKFDIREAEPDGTVLVKAKDL